VTVCGHREQGEKHHRQFKDFVLVITLEEKENKQQDYLIAKVSGRVLAIFTSFSEYVLAILLLFFHNDLAIFPHCLVSYSCVF
jgi:hypothetical protein